jgi:hypothetical protein
MQCPAASGASSIEWPRSAAVFAQFAALQQNVAIADIGEDVVPHDAMFIIC